MDARIGQNVRQLRHANKMTQAEAARVAGLSLAGFRKIEKGQVAPRPETLRSLARGFGVGVDELVRPVSTLTRVRFRSQKKLKSRDHILALVARRLTDYGFIEELVGERRKPATEGLRLRSSKGAPGSEAVRAAEALRRKMGLEDGEPVRDICGLLEARGIKLVVLPVASDGFFGLSVGSEDGGPAVVVNTWERISVERQIFTAAHELGHLVLHLGDYRVDEDAEDPAHEKEANAFASHFLMPDGAFRKKWEELRGVAFIDRVLKVKRMFGVSYATVLYRVAEKADKPERLWQMFYMQYKQRYGRSLSKKEEPEARGDRLLSPGEPPSANEPERLSALDFLPERLYRLVREAVEREEISLDRGAEVLGLSPVEMRQLARAWVE